MNLIKRNWKPGEADNWTKEDWYVIVLSPLNYILITIGLGLSMLLLPVGFILLGAGIILTILMHWIIDPKLKAISNEYEEKQHKYLEELEKKVRWEKENG